MRKASLEAVIRSALLVSTRVMLQPLALGITLLAMRSVSMPDIRLVVPKLTVQGPATQLLVSPASIRVGIEMCQQ